MSAATQITRLAGAVPHMRQGGRLPVTQRFASGVAGVSLFFSGMRRGGFLGLVSMVAGADLLYRGVAGEGHIHELFMAPAQKALPGGD